MLEELERWENAARERVEELREQMAELTRRLEAEEDRVSRLMITRETVEEILGEAVQVIERLPDEATGVGSVDVAADGPSSPLGVVTVPQWRPGMKVAVLPQAYQDAVEILIDAGGAMRAGQVAVAMGLPDEAAKREGLRSKLKRLVERGGAREEGPGLFRVTEPVARDVTGQADSRLRDGVASSPGR
ncbi:hypothetical protein ACFPOI_51275 [Nonomuraea angiospora]|uniref:Uncharacterized protein n=1 Tax=Nonomuraea angiospora TaxID=46172 RepID=A0ABR9M2A6_9ACTN|nr:hypothetical protein [Nonomuraea angiospora]MBE1586740.1 hypothetical protein [Nonomuraea angiospora]